MACPMIIGMNLFSSLMLITNLTLHACKFPGWGSFSSFIAHIQFINGNLSLKLTNFVTEPFKVHSNTLKIAVIQTVIKNEVKAVDNQLIDEALSLYNDLRLHAYKVLTHSDDRERVDKLVPRAFYRYERRKLLKNRHKFNPLRTPTRAMD